jgi:hypothetical protein
LAEWRWWGKPPSRTILAASSKGNLVEVPVNGSQEISELEFSAKLLHCRHRGLPRSKALLLAIGVGLLITP